MQEVTKKCKEELEKLKEDISKANTVPLTDLVARHNLIVRELNASKAFNKKFESLPEKKFYKKTIYREEKKTWLTEIEIIEARLQDIEQDDEKDKKIAELTDVLQRLQAEFENYKKRCDKDNIEFRNYVNSEMTGKLLPILDSFELALKNAQNKEEFVKGVEMIFGQLYDMIEKEGVRQIKTEGEKFDPYKHEILMSEKTDKEEDDEKIIEELQKGYMFKDRVLRYAKVKVLKK